MLIIYNEEWIRKGGLVLLFQTRTLNLLQEFKITLTTALNQLFLLFKYSIGLVLRFNGYY